METKLQKEINNSMPLFLRKGHLFEQYSKVIEKYLSNKNSYAVVADLSRHTEMEVLQKKFPEKIINVGIAEQNLLGISAGLASAANDAIVYSQTLASFLLNRGMDIIGQNICQDNLNVKLLGIASGISTNLAGMSHWMLNDLAMLRALPNLTILCPSDVFEVAKCIDYASNIQGPFYIRLPLPYYRSDATLQKECITKKGFYVHNDITKNIIITYGYQTETCKKICSENSDFSLIELYNVNKFSQTDLVKLLANAKNICFVEEHFVNGGIGESISNLLFKHKINCNYKVFGIEDFPTKVGSYDFMLKTVGLDFENLKRDITKFFN